MSHSMTLTTHATMGAFVGAAVGNIPGAFILSFVVHLLVDMIPHGDSFLADNFRVKKIKQKQAVAYVVVDGIVAILIVLFLANTKDVDSIRTFTAGILGGILPDLLVGIYDLTKTPLLKWFYDFHFFFHDYFVKRKGDVKLTHALAAQLIFVAILQARM